MPTYDHHVILMTHLPLRRRLISHEESEKVNECTIKFKDMCLEY